MTLTEFLLARIAEDEEAARVFEAHFMLLRDSSGRPQRETEPLPLRMTYARGRAECEAKRQIVEDYADAERAVKGYDHDAPTDAYWQEWGNRHALRLAVERLAAIYADHPDYDEEWKP